MNDTPLDSDANSTNIVQNPGQTFDVYNYMNSKQGTPSVHKWEARNSSCSSISTQEALANIVEENPECLTSSLFDETRDDVLEDLCNEYTLQDQEGSAKSDPVSKYCEMNYEIIEKELLARNKVAARLLNEYFPGDFQNGQKYNSNILGTISQTLIMLEKKTSDKELQVCLKPSDMYVIFDVNRNFPASEPPVKILRPYRYHKPNTCSSTLITSYIRRPVRALINFYMNENLHKGSSIVETRKNDKSFHTWNAEYKEYLNLKHTLDDSVNEVLYKNDSDFLRTDNSSEDNRDWEFEKSLDPYVSLRNLYSHSYLEDYWAKSPLKTSPEYSFKNSIPFADSYSEFHEADEEYRAWLEKRRLNKNIADYSIPTAATISTKSLLSSILESNIEKDKMKRLKLRKFKEEKIKKIKDRLEYMDNIGLINVLQYFFLYEHVVLINFIDFVSTFPSLNKKADMNVGDRLAQLLLIVVSYYIFRVLNSLEISKELSVCY